MQNVANDDVLEIDLVEIFSLLLHKIWFIVASGLGVGLLALVISAFILTPQYESTTKVYILNKQEGAAISYSDAQLATQLTKDYKELITCRYVLETVIEMCELEDEYEDLYERIAVQNTTDTRIISITVKDPSPKQAKFIADSVRDVASKHIKAVMDIEAVNIVDEANLATEPSEPSVLKWTVIGGFLGCFVCACVIVVIFLMDDTIKTADDVEKYLGLSTLALIPLKQQEKPSKRKRVFHKPYVRTAPRMQPSVLTQEAEEVMDADRESVAEPVTEDTDIDLDNN